MKYVYVCILSASLFLFVAASPNYTVFEDDVVLNPDRIGGLHIDGVFTVDIMPSDTPKIEIINTQDKNIKIQYAYDQGVTYIRMLAVRKWFSFLQTNKNTSHVIKIYTPAITDLTIAGASDISISNYTQEFKLDNVIMNISGSNNIIFSEIDAQRVNVKFTGSNDIRVHTIRSPNFKIAMSGSNGVYITQLYSGNVEVQSSGSGSVDVDTLEAENVVLEGSGSITVNIGDFLATTLKTITQGGTDVRITEGSVDNVDVTSSGSSTIVLPRVRITNAEIESSGSSEVRVYVTGSLYVNGRGSSTISYTGEPKIKSSISGSSQLLSNN